MRGGGHKDRTRDCDGLHPRSHGGRIAENISFDSATPSNYSRAAIDTYADQELVLVTAIKLQVQFCNRVHYGQSGANGARRVILVRLGPAEVGHQSVPEEFRDVATPARDR